MGLIRFLATALDLQPNDCFLAAFMDDNLRVAFARTLFYRLSLAVSIILTFYLSRLEERYRSCRFPV